MKKKFACVFVLCHNEKHFLPVLLKYYHQSFDWEDIYVYDHCSNDGSIVYSTDDTNDKIEKPAFRDGFLGHKSYFLRSSRTHNLKCNVDKVWKDDPSGDTFWNTKWIENFQRNRIRVLLEKYEYVVMPETDELLVPNPQKYKNLRHYIESLKKNNKSHAKATGYEIVHQPGELDLNWNDNIMDQRRYWMRYGMWDKTIINSKIISWSIGFHFVHGNYEPSDPDLILYHLKRVDWKRYLKFRLAKQGKLPLPANLKKSFMSMTWRTDPGNDYSKGMAELRKHSCVPKRGHIEKIPENLRWRKF